MQVVDSGRSGLACSRRLKGVGVSERHSLGREHAWSHDATLREGTESVMDARIVHSGIGSMRPQISPLKRYLRPALGELHLRRIDLADRVEVVNRGEHFGESTLREMAYAEAAGKPITFVGVTRATQ
jgi:hypothetical protein